MRAAIWSDSETITKEEMSSFILAMPAGPATSRFDRPLGEDFGLEVKGLATLAATCLVHMARSPEQVGTSEAVAPVEALVKSHNVEFLRDSATTLADIAALAEKYPESCLVKLRAFAEHVVEGLYNIQHFPKSPNDIIKKLRALEKEIAQELDEPAGMLG